MTNPEITTQRILWLLSNQWLPLNKIAENFQITKLTDKKYLNLKLKELNRKKKIVYIFHVNDIYWKKSRPEFEDQELSSFNIYTDFYRETLDDDPEDFVAWGELGYWYERFHQHSNAISCLEAIIDRDPTDAETWSHLGDNYDAMEEL